MARWIDLNLLTDILSYLKSKRTYFAELYAIYEDSFSVSLGDDGLEHLEKSKGGGVGIRLLSEDGKMGFAHTNSLTFEDLKKTADEALARLSFSSPDPFRRYSPPIGTYPDVCVYDDTISHITESQKIAVAENLYGITKGAHPKLEKVRKAEYNDGAYEVILANSLGILLQREGTYFSVSLAVLASEKDEKEMGYYSQEKRFFEELDLSEVSRKAIDRAVSLLGGKRVKSQKIPIILAPEVTADFISLFSVLLSAENVQKGKSLLCGRLGKKIASDKFTLIDDGTMEKGMGSAPFDAEGFPTKRKEVVVDGILETYLHNLYTASKDGVDTTGNAVRGYASIPSVGITNLFIMPGEKEPEEILKNVNKGLYILEVMGLHTVNLISGDFSLGVSGIWIENGEFAFPVKGVTIAGNLLEFFNRLEEVGKDLTFFGTVGGVTLVVSDVMVGGE